MSSILAQFSESDSYEVPPDFWSGTEEYPVVEEGEPGEGDRDELLLRKLGDRGWGRLHFFRQVFSGPWGESGRGKPLSPRAVEAFFSFLKHAEFSTEGKRPSLFLTDDGHLELCWEAETGDAVQVEFGSRESEVYDESSGREEVIPNARLPEVARELTQSVNLGS